MWPAASNSDKLYAFLGAQNTHKSLHILADRLR
jgi:hypothetical protein